MTRKPLNKRTMRLYTFHGCSMYTCSEVCFVYRKYYVEAGASGRSFTDPVINHRRLLINWFLPTTTHDELCSCFPACFGGKICSDMTDIFLLSDTSSSVHSFDCCHEKEANNYQYRFTVARWSPSDTIDCIWLTNEKMPWQQNYKETLNTDYGCCRREWERQRDRKIKSRLCDIWT